MSIATPAVHDTRRDAAQPPLTRHAPDLSKIAGSAVAATDGELLMGIDPGLQRTGYALLRGSAGHARPKLLEAGVIRLRREDAIEQRLVELERNLTALIDANQPAALICEQLYAHYKHPRTAILMGHARGVILALAARMNMAIVSVAATQVKKTLTGNGHAGKSHVQRAVAATLRLAVLPEPHDVADAIAIALCGLELRRASFILPRGRA